MWLSVLGCHCPLCYGDYSIYSFLSSLCVCLSGLKIFSSMLLKHSSGEHTPEVLVMG